MNTDILNAKPVCIKISAQNTVDTYYGEAMAVVRAGEAGSVKITVSDEERTYTCEIPVIVAK